MPKIRKQTIGVDSLAFSQQTSKLLKMVMDIGGYINLIKEHNYKLFDLDLKNVKGKSVKELVGSMMDATNSVVDRATTDYDIFDIGLEIDKYELLLREYREVVPDKILITNMERVLAEFRSSFRAVYKGGGASVAYELIITANDLVKHIEILGYLRAQPKISEAKQAKPPMNKYKVTKPKENRQSFSPEIDLGVVAVETITSIEPTLPVEEPIKELTLDIIIEESLAPVNAKGKQGRKKKADITNGENPPLALQSEQVSLGKSLEGELVKSKRGRKPKGATKIAIQEEEAVSQETLFPLIEDLSSIAGDKIIKVVKDPLIWIANSHKFNSLETLPKTKEAKGKRSGRKPKALSGEEVKGDIETLPLSAEVIATNDIIEPE